MLIMEGIHGLLYFMTLISYADAQIRFKFQVSPAITSILTDFFKDSFTMVTIKAISQNVRLLPRLVYFYSVTEFERHQNRGPSIL